MLQAEGTTLARKALDRSEEAMIASGGLEACFLTKETHAHENTVTLVCM